MHISKLEVNTDFRPARAWLKNIYRVHQRLCMAFPSAHRKQEDKLFLKPFSKEDFEQVNKQRKLETGFLFRIDPAPERNPIILVQSALEPDWDYAFQNAPFLAAPPEWKEYRPRFEAGEKLRFRLLANPTKKINTKTRPDGEKSNGRRVPVPREELLSWLDRKGESGGFKVDKEKIVIQPSYVYFNKSDDKKSRLFSARFDGLLEVTNSEEFIKTLASGVGPAKGFGFGLLSVASP